MGSVVGIEGMSYLFGSWNLVSWTEVKIEFPLYSPYKKWATEWSELGSTGEHSEQRTQPARVRDERKEGRS